MGTVSRRASERLPVQVLSIPWSETEVSARWSRSAPRSGEIPSAVGRRPGDRTAPGGWPAGPLPHPPSAKRHLRRCCVDGPGSAPPSHRPGWPSARGWPQRRSRRFSIASRPLGPVVSLGATPAVCGRSCGACVASPGGETRSGICAPAAAGGADGACDGAAPARMPRAVAPVGENGVPGPAWRDPAPTASASSVCARDRSGRPSSTVP